ncbi:rhomboid-like protein [Nocardia yamanashiensis]|uniref:rhomboid-like protein n=1 Tax=Nocardia yamanashiensis TaxID=209247 RepID=UPI001F2B944E|nr:rhomboid-like protein [Nocardia yamanashiensis]
MREPATGRPRLRVTLSYLLLLALSTIVLTVLNDAAATKVVLHASTNLHNLLHGHVGTLFSSALIIGDDTVAWGVLIMFGALLALSELRFGGRRLLAVFLAGHIGATLLVAIGLWIGVHQDWLPDSIASAEDVGISYGAMALVGALIASIPSDFRFLWAAGWSALAIDAVLAGRTFTNVGHLLALAIGLALGYRMLKATDTPRRRLTWIEGALLALAVLLSAALLIG